MFLQCYKSIMVEQPGVTKLLATKTTIITQWWRSGGMGAWWVVVGRAGTRCDGGGQWGAV